MSESSACTCMLVCVFLCTLLHTRPRVQQAPGIPCALLLWANEFTNLGRIAPRDCGVVSEAIIVRSEATKQSSLAIPLHGLLRGACHRARIRATRWLAMTTL